MELPRGWPLREGGEAVRGLVLDGRGQADLAVRASVLNKSMYSATATATAISRSSMDAQGPRFAILMSALVSAVQISSTPN